MAPALAELLIELGPAGIAFFEPRSPFRVFFHNRAYQALFPEHFRSEGVVGRGLPDYVPGAAASGIEAVFFEVARSGETRRLVEFPHAGVGHEAWFDWSLSAIARGGRVVALAHMASEVSAQGLSHRRVEELAAAAERDW